MKSAYGLWRLGAVGATCLFLVRVVLEDGADVLLPLLLICSLMMAVGLSDLIWGKP